MRKKIIIGSNIGGKKREWKGMVREQVEKGKEKSERKRKEKVRQLLEKRKENK